ncbi:hypothetical protein ACOMHN_017137 [Nucella lapillus]
MALLSNHKLQLSHLRADQRPEPEPEVAEQEAKEVPTQRQRLDYLTLSWPWQPFSQTTNCSGHIFLMTSSRARSPSLPNRRQMRSLPPLNPGLGLWSCDCSVSMVPGLSSYFSLCDHVPPPGPY